MNFNSTLKTSRTTLRRLNLTDFANMRRLESDPEIIKYSPMRIPLTPEQTQSRLEKQIEKQKAQVDLGVWAVDRQDDGEFIGWFMLQSTDQPHPELGFMIVREFWGQGYAFEVAQRLIEYGFQELRLNAISACTDFENEKSIHLLNKLGFQFVRNHPTVDKVFNREIILKIFELQPL